MYSLIEKNFNRVSFILHLLKIWEKEKRIILKFPPLGEVDRSLFDHFLFHFKKYLCLSEFNLNALKSEDYLFIGIKLESFYSDWMFFKPLFEAYFHVHGSKGLYPLIEIIMEKIVL